MKIIPTGHKPILTAEKAQVSLAKNNSLQLTKNRTKFLEQAYLQLARDTVLWDSSLDIFLLEVCRTVSKTLNVGRVGIFKMNKEQSSLDTLSIYEATISDYKMPKGILRVHFPRYFSALENFGIIDAHDAHNDPRTSELSEAYLTPLGISSMLEVSLYKSGRLSGVICSEHIGGIRHWLEPEKLFVNSVSSLVSQRLLFEKITSQTEQQSELNAFHQAMINNSSYCALTVDHKGKVKTLNNAVTELLGYEPQDLLDQDLFGKIIPSEDMQGIASELSNEFGFEIASGFEILFTMVSQKISEDYETMFRTKDGMKIPVNLSVSALRTETGELKGYLCTASNISEQINTRQALHLEEQRYRFLFEGSNDGMFLMQNSKIVDCNQACQKLYGCSKDEFLGTGIAKNTTGEISETSGSLRIHQLRFSPEFQEDGQLSALLMIEKYNQVANSENSIYFDWKCKRYDGTLFDGEITFSRIDIDRTSHVLVSVRDVSARKISERELAFSNTSIIKRNKNLALINNLSNELHATHSVDEIYQKTLDVLTDLEYSPAVALFTVDSKNQTMNLKIQDGIDENIVKAYQKIPINPDFEGVALKSGVVCYSTDIAKDPRFSQKLKDDAKKLGYRTSVIIPVVHQDEPLATINVAYKTTQVLDSELLDVSSSISKTVSLALANAHNQSKLEYRAEHDSLTGLGNRDHFHNKFKEILLKGRHSKASLFLLDLDRFKEVNDTLGHFTGDKVLKMIGPRIQKVLSTNSCVSCLVSRMGGDEFALMIYGENSKEDVVDTAQSIIDCLKEPFRIDDLNLEIEASVGIALYPKDGLDSHALLRSADVAMYQAKQEGSGFSFYDENSDVHTRERLAIMGELSSSITAGQLFLHYQPKIDINNSEVLGFEALVRWNHPSMGMLNPGVFIPLIEMTNSIYALTEEVLNQALAQQQEWLKEGHEYTVAVNLSARNLNDDRIVKLLPELLEKYDTPSGMLELEITETALMHDPERALSYLHQIAALGIHLSIDDFGTGYSSLSYLRDLPIHKLKLDREFIMDMISNEQGAKIVETIISLSKDLRLTVIAEGVEDQKTLDILRKMNCNQAQGYYICRPNTWDKIDHWLKERRLKLATS